MRRHNIVGGMAMSERRQLLTIGVFFIAFIVAILLYVAGAIGWTLIIPVVLVVFGVWMIAMAAMRGMNPAKYERSSFSTAIMGALLVAIGGAWYLFSFNWLYSLVLILLVFAGAAIAAALKRK
jgi:hypothetical protein